MPQPRTLEIHVHRIGNPNNHKPGTFTGPPPKMRVDVGDTMTWTLTVHPADPTATFEVRFLGPFWPFQGPLAPITAAAPAPSPAVNPGSYLYAVQVTAATWSFTINHCPEADVGP
jgi:hypothetical protein